MIRLTTLIPESTAHNFPSPKLAGFLFKHFVTTLSDQYLYHGTPLVGLKQMLTSGIYGTQHGEIAEYETLSTSFNSEVLDMFSEGDGTTGLQFHVNGVKLLVMNDVIAYLATQSPGSGLDLEVDPEALAKYTRVFKIPSDRFTKGPAFPYGYLSSLGIDAVVYEYAWNHLQSGGGHVRDESEICFIGKGVDKLNHCISEIYVDGEAFDSKEEALNALSGIETDDQS